MFLPFSEALRYEILSLRRLISVNTFLMSKKKRKSTRTKKKKKTDKEYIRLKRLSISLFIIAVTGIVSFFIYKKWFSKEPNTFTSKKYVIKGIDISHHQPVLNWNMVNNQNITFAYIKATEGITLKDRNYKTNYDTSRETNIHIGSYHFYIFGLSGSEQARNFINTAKCQTGDMIPAIDVEHSKSNPYSTDSTFSASTRNELITLEKELYDYYGVHPVIYTNKDCYKLYVKNLFPDNIIWICDLYNEPSDDIKNWRLWQFSHEGKLPGVTEKIDLNYYRYSFREFNELLLP